MEGNDKAIINHSPQEAQDNGISTVYQEVNLCPNLTVAENLFIGREPRKFGMIDWKQMNERSRAVSYTHLMMILIMQNRRSVSEWRIIF